MIKPTRLSAALVLAAACALLVAAAPSKDDASAGATEWQLPRADWKTPFAQERPILFVNRAQAASEWDKLPAYWNEAVQTTVDPKTAQPVTRKAVKIKVPLGLSQNPPVPLDNPMTVAKWELGKRLFYDPIVSSDRSVACATCHDPNHAFTDASPFSTGIKGLKGGMSAPTVFNTAFNTFQFWDGRAASLEDQAQGPVQNPVEMFDGDGHAWNKLVARLRADPQYVGQFRAAFGADPTRDAAAKAVACFERTVLCGDSLYDRAEVAMRKRVAEEEGKLELKAEDFEKVLSEAFAVKDANALTALGLDPAQDAAKAPAMAKSLASGRNVFFGKARCNSCHAGDNFTDNQFHNLGVGFGPDGKQTPDLLGRFAALPVGDKNPDAVGAFKTPTLRRLVGSAPYLHNGSEATLEQVVDFYDKGGVANEYLDPKMRDFEPEKAYRLGQRDKLPKDSVRLFGPAQEPVVPLRLNLTDAEKKDLVLFLKALQGDAPDPALLPN